MESCSWLVVGMATRRCSSARKPPSSKYFSARAMAPSRDPVVLLMIFPVPFAATIAKCQPREDTMLTSGRVVFTDMEEVHYGKPAAQSGGQGVESDGAGRVFPS